MWSHRGRQISTEESSSSVGWLRGNKLYFSQCRGEGQGNGGWGCAEVRGYGLCLKSFPGVEVLLELGARVEDVEALLAYCVVAMETDQHSISR